MRQIQLWGKFENHLLNQGVTKVRVNKLLAMFSIAERGLRKDFENLTRDDIEKFVTNLHRNNFRKLNGEDFSGSTKSDLKKFLKQFYKWYKGENEFYPKEVSWIKPKISKDELPKEKSVIDVEQVRNLANTFTKIEYRVLILLLFDTGFRIGEALSIKKKDITWENYDENEKCFWAQCNKSKTEIRKVPAPLFTADLQAFFNSSYFQNLKDEDIIFNINYDYFLRQLKENSINLFNKDTKKPSIIVSPHALRHSSATYYARAFDGNLIELAERYGWTYNSKELRTYIRRSGAYQKSGVKKIFTNEVLKVKEENAQLKEDMAKLQANQKDIARLQADQQEVMEKFNQYFPSLLKLKERLLK